MKALITSGGKGTRLRPLTYTQNKHLLPIANKPILFYALETVAQAGITEVGIITHQEGNEVKEVVKDGSQFGLHVTYIPQEAPLGLAHVIKISQDFIKGDPFVFYLGDNMVVGGIHRFTKAFLQNQVDCYLTLARVKDPERFGVPEIVDGRIVSIEEKPSNPRSEFAVSGIYIYNASIFEAVNNIKPSARGELEISDAHQYLLDHGYRIGFSEITGWWKDTGKPEDILEANRLVLENLQPKNEGRVDVYSHLAGNVILESGAQVMKSNIRGPVIIGKNTIIENSYIGPFTSIGDDCVVRNSELEFSIVLSKCAILDVGIRIESSLFGVDTRVTRVNGKPKAHRFMVGDQSRVEVA